MKNKDQQINKILVNLKKGKIFFKKIYLYYIFFNSIFNSIFRYIKLFDIQYDLFFKNKIDCLFFILRLRQNYLND